MRLVAIKKIACVSLWAIVSTLNPVWTAPCYALSVAEFRAEDVIPLLSEFKVSAKLNANQQLLWQQTESRVTTLLRQREQRQRAMQEQVKQRLQEKAPELRDLAKAMDQDDALALQENQQLREYWMTLYDALSDTQREALTLLLNEQLLRAPEHGREHSRGDGDKPGAGRRPGGKGGQRPPSAG